MAVKWFYNSDVGQITSWDTSNPYFEAQLHVGIGWHGPFDTKQAALDYYNANKAANPGWSAPTGSLLGKIGNATGASSVINNSLGLSDDSIRSWLIRLGEIVLGVVLVAVGAAKLTGTSNKVASMVKAKVK